MGWEYYYCIVCLCLGRNGHGHGRGEDRWGRLSWISYIVLLSERQRVGVRLVVSFVRTAVPRQHAVGFLLFGGGGTGTAVVVSRSRRSSISSSSSSNSSSKAGNTHKLAGCSSHLAGRTSQAQVDAITSHHITSPLRAARPASRAWRLVLGAGRARICWAGLGWGSAAVAHPLLKASLAARLRERTCETRPEEPGKGRLVQYMVHKCARWCGQAATIRREGEWECETCVSV